MKAVLAALGVILLAVLLGLWGPISRMLPP